ncbi:unnamed protein product [Schistocephalus solidus]|uniref:Coiled-coil domain-containing protein 181 n=1 Tax=Schistocephalus solidus TaxID=70667 RepID=A0A183S7I8_SCHSO|nr:unnamed protein product [Schistocephalus solidus]
MVASGLFTVITEKPPVYQVSSETASIVIHARENLSSLTSVDEHSGISNKDEQHYMKDLAGDGFNPDENIKEGSICVLNEVRDVEENSTRQRKISTASWTASEPTNPREFQYEALSEDEDDEEAELLRRRVAELNAALALEPPIERLRPPQASRVAFKESLVDFEVSFPPDELQSEAEEASSQALHCLPVPVSVSTAEQMQLEEQSMEKGAMKFAKVQSVCSSEAPSLGPPEIITRTPPASLESSYRKKPSMKNGRGEAVSEMGNTKDAATSASISVSISKKDVGRTRRISHSGDVGRHAERPVPVSPKVRPNSSSLSLQKAKTPRSSAKTSIGKRKEQEEELEKARLMTEERRRMNEKVMQAEEEKRRQESFQTWLHQKEMQRNWERLLKEREEEEKREKRQIVGSPSVVKLKYEMDAYTLPQEFIPSKMHAFPIYGKLLPAVTITLTRRVKLQVPIVSVQLALGVKNYSLRWLRRKNREAQQRARESKERRRIGQAILLQRQRSGAVIRALQRANAGNLFFDVDPDF